MMETKAMPKNILITGANSYIGMAVEQWLMKQPEKYKVYTLDTINLDWNTINFFGYDVIFHVAGIAHRKEKKANINLYYEVNEKLAIRVAEQAKKDGVRQFIILSSMSVYGKDVGHIKKDTPANPKSHYGISKYRADLKIMDMEESLFKVAILRPPMVYGKGCKGNYQLLRKVALKSPVFPNIKNMRSMIYIDNLAEFVKRMIDNELNGLFFPQDTEYVNTAEMVKKIGESHRKTVKLIKIFNPFILMGERCGVKILKKVFGSLTYDKCDAIGLYEFDETIARAER